MCVCLRGHTSVNKTKPGPSFQEKEGLHLSQIVAMKQNCPTYCWKFGQKTLSLSPVRHQAPNPLHTCNPNRPLTYIQKYLPFCKEALAAYHFKIKCRWNLFIANYSTSECVIKQTYWQNNFCSNSQLCRVGICDARREQNLTKSMS